MREEGKTPDSGDDLATGLAPHSQLPKLSERSERAGEAYLEVESLFSPSVKHIQERKEWVAVAKIDDRETGSGPLDLESGTVRIEVPSRDS
ncbi:hypothetical protein EV193_102202 [Herbihabitans rhizosphaerae]|uniref:Uncharacterized protein n=2 Tax=Herbihabitans rhizosphaerae TaxID=1872711 RepID=A0A4V2EU38_9PSEU|nr:hypothetical protein EV193_102202 [Herbihabitans rhizosphaerae]